MSYAEDAVMWAPLGPDGLAEPIRGRDAIVQYLEGVFPILGSMEIKNLFASSLGSAAILTDSKPTRSSWRRSRSWPRMRLCG